MSIVRITIEKDYVEGYGTFPEKVVSKDEDNVIRISENNNNPWLALSEKQAKSLKDMLNYWFEGE